MYIAQHWKIYWKTYWFIQAINADVLCNHCMLFSMVVRLQELQHQMVGGEQANNEEVKQRRQKKKRHAEERKKKLAGEKTHL